MHNDIKLRRREIVLASLLPLALPVRAQPAGAEILIGQTMPYSGPASSYSVIGKSEAAYFEKLNAEGGVNGRKIKLISLDDGYSPPKAVEQTRRLVEQEKVLAIFGTFGTPTNAVIRKFSTPRRCRISFRPEARSSGTTPSAHPTPLAGSPTTTPR